MASTAAMVFFWRPERVSRRALLTGFLTWAVADAASRSTANEALISFMSILRGRCKDNAGGGARATRTASCPRLPPTVSLNHAQPRRSRTFALARNRPSAAHFARRHGRVHPAAGRRRYPRAFFGSAVGGRAQPIGFSGTAVVARGGVPGRPSAERDQDLWLSPGGSARGARQFPVAGRRVVLHFLRGGSPHTASRARACRVDDLGGSGGCSNERRDCAAAMALRTRCECAQRTAARGGRHGLNCRGHRRRLDRKSTRLNSS